MLSVATVREMLSKSYKEKQSRSFAKDHKTPDLGTNVYTDNQTAEIFIEEDRDQQIDNLLMADEKMSEQLVLANLNDDPLKEIQDEYEEDEEAAPKVSEKLANVVQAMAGQKMSEEKVKEKVEKHKRPENVEVHVPKVNPEIWALMDHTAKSADLKAQRTQKKLLKATYALTKVCKGFVVKPSSENSDQLRDTTDAMSLILRATHDLSMERCVKILSASNINKKYRRLSSLDIQVSDYLFGDDRPEGLTICH